MHPQPVLVGQAALLRLGGGPGMKPSAPVGCGVGMGHAPGKAGRPEEQNAGGYLHCILNLAGAAVQGFSLGWKIQSPSLKQAVGSGH